ncbi:MAG TPA: rhodanese-like domain-containing protein [Candidatus Limnocylindrales bacterium]|nr:rhodanese-like domain-containing protein [Candidatus Limnocylindrales bacterium]
MTRLATRVVLGLLLVVLVGCGSSAGPAVTKVDAATAVGMLGTRTVLDVRTPAEFAAGHVAGARNLDVEAPGFAAQLGALDPAGAYLVYCHSGRRSALAAEQMAKAGFGDIVDGGAMADLVAAGAPTQ